MYNISVFTNSKKYDFEFKEDKQISIEGDSVYFGKVCVTFPDKVKRVEQTLSRG